MDYIYDIVLNFQNEYYDFYEWQPNDKIINVKKIPIYKTDDKSYLDIKNNNVTINRNTIPKQNKMFLLTSGLEIIGILINNDGKILKKSSLIFEENDELLEDIDLIKEIDIKYTINKKNNITHISRIKKEKLEYLTKYFNNIDKLKEEYFLKYLYYDIYNEDEIDIDKVYNNLLSLIKDNPTKIYSHLKKIELELKKPSNWKV